MVETKNRTKDLKLYSQKSISGATFLGGPLAAGYLIRENFLVLNKPDEAKKAMVYGVLATLVIFGVIFAIPESIIDKIPKQIIPLTYTAAIYFIVDKIMGKELNAHKENKNEFFSGWKAAGIGLISLIILFVGIFGYAFLTPDAALNQYDKDLVTFSTNENESLSFYDKLSTEPDHTLVHELNNKTIPLWKENIEILKRTKQIEDLPIELLKQNETLLKYSELRLETFELFKRALVEGTGKYDEQLQQLHLQIDQQLKKLEQL